MNFQIQVVQVDKQTKPTAKGSYQQLEVAFKNLGSGKLESKKIMDFANKAVFQTLVGSKQGDVFTVTSEKNDKTGYWDWTNVVQAAPGETPKPAATGGNPAPKSTYETPEERAKRQVCIVRQSALDRAVQLLSIGAKIPPSNELVFNQAQQFVDWVFEKPSLFDEPNDLPEPEVQ